MKSILNNKILLAALMAIGQSGILYYMIESRASILRTGREVVLKTEPVDPRDLMRGDYVTLGYPLSRIDPALVADKLPPGASGTQDLHIAVVKDGGDPELWTFSRASWAAIVDPKPEEVILVGKTPDYFSQGVDPVPLILGIERYYVPEGEGKPIEEGVREKAVHVVVAVSAEGKAQIKSLRLDGQTLYEEPIY